MKYACRTSNVRLHLDSDVAMGCMAIRGRRITASLWPRGPDMHVDKREKDCL